MPRPFASLDSALNPSQHPNLCQAAQATVNPLQPMRLLHRYLRFQNDLSHIQYEHLVLDLDDERAKRICT